MLATYRRALALPGAWQFSVTGLVARLPIAMIGLGIVLLISTKTGSYALAGFLSAAFQVAAAAGAIATSRWIDRVGQHRLLPWLGTLSAAALIAFVVAVEAAAPVAVQAVLVACTGVFQPAIGSMVRARWAALAPDTDRLRSAFALESVIDELIFSIGPLATVFLAFQLALPAPLVAGAALGAIGAVVLSLQRRTEPVASGHRARAESGGERSGALRQPGLLLVVVGAMGVGAVFGSYEVSVVAFTRQAGESWAAGVILALWALASMLAGIVFGARGWRLPLARQVMILPAVLALALAPALLVSSVPQLALVTALAGMAVAPALIALFSLTERLVPTRLLTEGLTWTNSGLALGFSAGTTLGGVVIDAHGTTWSFVLPVVGAGLGALVAAVGQPTLMRASVDRPLPPPALTWNTDPLPGPGPRAIMDDPGSARGRGH